jgi:periplasmic protein TonB
MLIERVLIPVDVEVVRVEIAAKAPRDVITLGSPAVAVDADASQAEFALGKELFAETMLENSPTRPRRRALDFAVSATVQTIFLTVVLLLPLYFSEAIDIHQFNKALLVAPPPPAPPPPPASLLASRSAAPKRRALSVEGKFLAPRVIPRQVARVTEEPSGNDSGAAINPGDGVPGGVLGGQPGGVIGGVLSGPVAPPVPIDSAPKAPIRVGGGVKAPRLIFAPDPVYPLLAKRSRVSGAVVIDAVVDTQGNVVEMHPASGNPLLLIAGMEALRHWKYEPTILGGQAYPVRLLVTITFELKEP